MTTVSVNPVDHPALDEKATAGASRVDHGQVLEHEYDGIKEYDNPLPRWWVLLFWASFWFSAAYYFYVQICGKGQSDVAAYESDQIAAREQKLSRASHEKVSEESLQALTQDPAVVADAKLLFTQRCAACHGPNGEGLIGPNLSDASWIHGDGHLLGIYQVISEGVPSKGMPTWEAQLTPIELRKVAAFVGSLRGKNLPGKAPEGTPMSP